jgi:hypothetical protein
LGTSIFAICVLSPTNLGQDCITDMSDSEFPIRTGSGLDRNILCSMLAHSERLSESVHLHDEICVTSCFFAEAVVRYDE